MDDVITENLRGFEIKFKTKPGVFSRQGLDSGTRLLIDQMEIEDGTMIADLGSGSGVLGLVAAQMNPNGHIHLLDDHLRSVELSKENVELNSLKNVEVYLSDLFQAVSERTYDQIFSNPPQQLGNDFLEELVSESFKHLKQGGNLQLVVKNNIKPVVERFLTKIFLNCEIISRTKEHVILKGEKKNG